MMITSRTALILLAIVIEASAPQSGRALESTSEASGSKHTLTEALTLHATFDKGLDADYSRGDKTCFDLQGKKVTKAALNDEVRLAPDAGRFGGALHFTKKNQLRPAFKNASVLGYNDKAWSGSIAVWLRLNPDKDLEPGYCDPVQIVGDDAKKGFIFLEWAFQEVKKVHAMARA